MASSNDTSSNPPTDTYNNDPHYQNTIGNQLTPKPSKTFRILGQNANGISSKNDFNKWQEILQSTVSHEIDCLNLYETNLDWNHPTITTKIPDITKRFFNNSRLSTSTSSIRFDRIYKPGGVASLVTNEWTGRILRCEPDSSGLGRWTTTLLNGKHPRKIALISAYQVCKTSIHSCGINTAFAQQWHLLRSQGDDIPDPRRRFWEDLTKYIHSLQANNFQIILTGDFNTPLTDTSHNPILSLLSKCNLQDAIAHFHDCTNQTSYSRGPSIIDFCFVSLNLLECITACGYLPLHFFCFSDHRGLYIDFDSASLFGGQPPKIAKPTARFVKSRDSQATSKFLERLGVYWRRHNIRSRINRLASVITRATATPSVRRFAAKIDNDRTRSFLMAEKKCHRRERPPWSRPLHRLSRQFRYWQIVLSDLRLGRHSYNALIAIEDELNWRPPFYPSTIQEAYPFMVDTKKALKAIRKQADQHRSKDLQLQAQEAALAGDMAKAKILRRLHHAETTHKAFLKLRRFLKPKNLGGVTKLELPINQPDGTTTTELTEDPQIIETACLNRNKIHFQQAQGTPFTVPPLNLIESSACGPISDAILDGRLDELPFDVNTLPKAQQVILEELQQCCPTMDDTISFDDFKRKFTIWREDTSTSPSGMYLGLYKALISRNLHEGTIDSTILQTGEDIFLDIFILSNLACRFGFAFDRWKEVVNCMINKKTDSFLLNQLRVIHLFEADYNLIIGIIFGRYMIHRICDNQTFHPSQWGRPNRECEDVLMLKELTYQVANMSRTDIATFDNDASSCYDRIVTRFALLCCRAHGVPEGPCRMTAEVLDNVIHKIKTAYGISEESYVNHPNSPIHGVGQGSQDGPSLWGVSSSITFRGADRLAHGLTCVNPSHDIPKRSIIHSRKLDGFIDDVTGWFNRMLQELRTGSTFPVSALARGMQRDAETWQTLLDISGGKLAIAKCLYYLGHWQWAADGTPEFTPATQIGDLISLTDEIEQVNIPHFDANSSHLTLGVWKSPAGNLEKQLQHLREKSAKWTQSMRSAPLTKDEALMSYSRIYIPSLRYGLGTCYFSPKDLLTIQRPAIRTILPKMGFNQHLPRDVVFGPRNLGGLGLPSLVFEQGLQQIQFIGRHLRSPTSPLRPLFQISLEWYRTLAGYTTCPLATPHLPISHVEGAKWYVSLQEFLSSIRHSLDIPNLLCPKKLRDHDQAIMSLPQAGFSTQELLYINRCRLFLQVHTISEISTADGTHLLSSIWRGQQPTNSYSKLLWPRQQRPFPLAWRAWRRFLAQALRPSSYTVYSANLPLLQPLGSWFKHFPDDRQWSWFYSPATSSLLRFDRLAKSFQVHPVTHTLTRLTSDIDPESCCYDMPLDAVPCDPRTDYANDRIYLNIRFPYAPISISNDPRPPCPYTDPILPIPNFPPQPTPQPPSTWPAYRHQLPKWEADLLPVHLDPSIVQFILDAHRQRATIYHCSDGSSVDHRGSFGWAFGPNKHVMMRHAGLAYGFPMDSYLAEAYGLLSSSCFWFRATKFTLHRTHPHFRIKIYCDNKSLVQKINGFLQYYDGSFRRCLIPNYDVVFMTACALRSLPPKVRELHHIKGHQDTLQPTANLSWPAQLNVTADHLAGAFLQNSILSDMPTPFLPSAQIHLRDSHHNFVLKRWNFHLRSAFYRSQYERWLIRQFQWDDLVLRTVDFEGLSLTLRTLPTHLQRFVLKWTNQNLPVRRRVHRYDSLIPPTCRCCPSIIECDSHFLQCPSEPRRSACAEAYSRITTKLQQLHTEPGLQQRILHRIATAFLIPSCPPPPTDLDHEQHHIGPAILFMKGRWSKQFRSRQESFYRAQHRSTSFTGDRWMRHTLSLIFEQIHQVWLCRNNQTHGSDQTLQEQFRREQLAIRVHALYNQLPNLLAHDRHALNNISAEDLLSGPTSSIITWLRLSEPTIRRCLKDAHDKLLHNQTDIRDYFEEASYVDSSASDTTLSFDTLETSGTISFTDSDSGLDSDSSSTCTWTSAGTPDSGTDDSFCPSPA